MKKISFVIPIYNEENNTDELYKVLNQVISEILINYNYEIIFINDGSKDTSISLVINLQKKDTKIKVIDFSRNFGHQAVITAGIDNAQGDRVIIMYADLQNPPKIALALIKKWKEGYEVVYTQRKPRRDN